MNGRHAWDKTAAGFLLVVATVAWGQDLTPRAYVITPRGSSAVILSYSWNGGSLVFDPTLPVDNGKGTFSAQILSYYRAFSLLGRSANFVVSAPYIRGDFEAVVGGSLIEAYRSGLSDTRVRFSVNLRGGPAMRPKEFAAWSEKGLLGVSFTTVIPTGQNDPARLINPGANRWAFKPEIGFSRRWGRWVTDVYGGGWLFRENPQFYPGKSVRTQRPIGSVEGHLTYYVRPRLWTSFDINFWNGGSTSVDGVANKDVQRNSRAGGTVAIPVSRHHAFKVSYSRGAYVRIGGNFRTVSVAWQYSWLGKLL
jgi:hypothetical protein